MEKGWPASEIAEQITMTRAQQGAGGNVHFSMKALLRNTGGVADALTPVYPERVLVPATTWTTSKPPAAPRLQWQAGALLWVQPGDATIVRVYAIAQRVQGKWSNRIEAAATDGSASVAFERQPDEIAVTAINRNGAASKPAMAKR